ncbi:MAG: hypothetical protein ACTHMC_14110 [Pseudobacter sp.]|uniref:hypothetical protein n=1 Tax=Pseudobacter sp. TaxID=2045420 RepID=UPI003F7CD754
MSDHDFEKQVQSKMEQLRLRPSDAVWTKVDKRIRKERRRRRVILWLPLLLLTIAAGGFFLFENNSHNNNITASELKSTHSNTESTTSATTEPSSSGEHADVNATPQSIEPATASVNPPETGGQHPSVQHPHTAIQTPEPGAQPTTKPGLNENKTLAAKQPVVAPAARSSVNEQAETNGAPVVTNRKPQPKNELVGNGPNGNKTSGIRTAAGNKRASGPSNKKGTGVTASAGVKPSGKPTVANSEDQMAKNDPVNHQASVPAVDSTNDVAQSDPEPQKVVIRDSSNMQAQPLTPLKPVLTAKKENKPSKANKLPEPPKRKPSTWSFGIVAEAGASHISKGSPFSLLDKKNTEQEDLAQSSPAPGANSSLGGPAGFTQLPPNKPASLKMGLSWSAGGFAQKKISNRVSLSAGIQYSYFSQETQVGNYFRNAISVSNANYDQVVYGYWQGRSSSFALNPQNIMASTSPGWSSMHDYTNKYHFIEIPVKIHWRMTGEDQLPLILDGGLSIAQLLSTNALHYDGSNDVYYKDFRYFNKTQAGITAGVNVELFGESNHPVWIGPTIKYQLSNLLKSDLSGGQHLWQFGVGAKVFLKK